VLRILVPVLAAAALAAPVPVVAPAVAATLDCDGRPATIVVPLYTRSAEGTEGDDVIYVEGISTSVDGLGGDDVMCTSDRSGASLSGGEGRDQITGRGNLDGGPGDDVVVSTTGSFIDVRGGEGDDRILAKGASGRSIYPGPGDDTIEVAAARSRYQDVIRFSDATDGVTIRVADSDAGTVDGEGHDTFRGDFFFTGTLGHDTFYGSSGPDSFSGSGGDDEVWGFGGDDRLHAHRPGLMDGGSGNDLLFPELGGLARGGPGDDVFDTWMERALTAGEPLISSYSLYGGEGRDTFRLRSYSDDDRVVPNPTVEQLWRGAVAGGPGTDTLDLTLVRTAIDADLRAGRARWSGGSARLARVDSVIGSTGDDVLRGNAGSNRLVGRSGNDLLIGREGRDTADGGPGRDTCGQIERRAGCERR
jgi:Ca2+-binding RTX toxin-like protein